MNEDDLRTSLTRVAHRASADGDALERIAHGHRRREVRRRTLTATGGVASLALMGVLAVQLIPGDREQTFGGNPSTSPTAAPDTSTFAAEAIVYQERDGRLMFHRVDGETEEVTTPGQPRFASLHPGETVRFVTTSDDGTESRIWAWYSADPEDAQPEASIPVGAAREIADPVAGRIGAADWSGGGSLAYLTRNANAEGPAELFVEVVSERRKLWTFPAWLGRGVSSDDELRIEWSPDGRHLLVVNTFVDAAQERQDETLLVFDVETGERVLTRHGTLARWEPDGKILYSPLGDGADQRWRRMDLSGQEAILSVKGGTNPAVSPSGEWVAIERPDTSETIVVNLRREVAPRTIRGAAPLWFDDTTILTTETKPCGTDCLEHPTIDTGRVHMECIAEICDTADRTYPIATTRGAVAAYVAGGEGA